MQPVVEDIFEKYLKTSIEVTNPANTPLFDFLSALEARATAEAAKEKTIDPKDIAIITRGLMVIKNFGHPVNTEKMVDAMWKKGSSSVDGVEVKKQSKFGEANAELIKFWINNQEEGQDALIEKVLQNAKAQAQAKSKKSPAVKSKKSPEEKKRKSKTSPLKTSPKKVTIKLKVSPSHKKQKTNS